MLVDFIGYPGNAIHCMIVYPTIDSGVDGRQRGGVVDNDSPLDIFVFAPEIRHVICGDVKGAVVVDASWRAVFHCHDHPTALKDPLRHVCLHA